MLGKNTDEIYWRAAAKLLAESNAAAGEQMAVEYFNSLGEPEKAEEAEASSLNYDKQLEYFKSNGSEIVTKFKEAYRIFFEETEQARQGDVDLQQILQEIKNEVENDLKKS